MMYALMMIVALSGPPQDPPQEVTMTRLLGIEIGTTADEAARILSPLGARDAKEEGGRIHEVWRLEDTGFDWLAFRLDAERRVVWITGHRRPGHEVPFDRFPDEPAVKTDTIAIWHVKGTHTGQRLTLRGSNGRAQVLTLAGHQ